MTAWDPCRTAEAVESLLVRNSGPAVIVAPFAKEAVISRLCSMVDDRVELFTRWLPHEVAAGISDLGVIDRIEATGGAVRLHPRVHAKLYLRGNEALVGSANASGTGLGYRSPAALELLVPVNLPCDPVSRLLEMLDTSSTEASGALRAAVEAEVSRIDIRAIPPAAGHEQDTDLSVIPPKTDLMAFRDPKAIWVYYSNPSTHEDPLGALALATIVGLGVPLGISDEETFKAFVGASMRQGVHGRVLHECRGLPPYQAVERFRLILAGAGTRIPAQQADREWRAFCNWAEEFVPEVELRSTKIGF